MRIFLIMLIVALCFSPTSAQPKTEYRLHKPDATEYLTALANLIPIIEDFDWVHPDDRSVINYVIYEEFWSRYHDLSSVPFEVLSQVNPFYLVLLFYGELDDPRDLPGWYTLMFNNWLREYQPDLSTQAVWNLNDEYTLKVQPVDFNGDGVDELIADLRHKQSDYFDFLDYFILQRDLTRPEGYKRLGDTHFWKIYPCSPCPGDYGLYQLDDVTGDGLPEWMVRGQYCGYGKCWIYLFIYSWWHDAFVLLTPGAISMEFASYAGSNKEILTYPPEDEGSWTFNNLDDDPALEFIQIQYINDTRNCEFSVTTVYQFNETAGEYQPDPPVKDYTDSAGCALRNAHEAMVQLDFDAAIDYYRHFLTFTPPPELVDVWTYARTRLAMAYVLSGQSQDAAAVLEAIDPGLIKQQGIRLWAEMVKTTFAANSHPLDFCAAVLGSFANQSFRESFFEDDLLNLYALTNDYAVSPFYVSAGNNTAETIGCNLSGFWEATIKGLNLQEDLAEQIKAAGWDIISIEEQDTDGDGRSETLIQVSLSVQTFMPITESGDWKLNSAFVWQDSENEHRVVLQTRELPSDFTFTLLTLPDGSAGLALIAYDDDPDQKCTQDANNAVFPGFVEVWRINQFDDLEPLRTYGWTICRPQTLAETFTAQGEVYLYKTLGDKLTIVSWNGSDYGRLPSDEAYSEDEKTLPCLYEIVCVSLDDTTEALTTIDQALANPPADHSPNFMLTLHYYRALVLEALDRPDEALTEYIYVYEAAPESAWGKLARLHLEIE